MIAALALIHGGCGSHDPQHDPQLLTSSELRLLDCAPCHTEIDAQWRESLHAHAWTDPIFQAEYATAPAPSCRGCHRPPSAASPARGIDCAACHVRGDVIVAARPSLLGALVHPVRADKAAAGVDACRACHQFGFTDDGTHDPNEALQDTVHEWEGSEAAAEGRACQGCHMPAERGRDGVLRASHRLPGLDDPALLAGAVEVIGHARPRPGGLMVEVRLRGRRIGHAFPTGDVFREAQLELRTDAGVRDTLVLKRWLAHTIDDDGEDHHLRTVDDTRVPAPGTGELTDSLWLADPTATRVHWELRLHRLPPAVAAARGLDEHTRGVLVARGVFISEPGPQEPS